jgi:signal transduction histidine kinase
MNQGTPAEGAVLDPTRDDPGMDETDVRLATHLRILARVSRASNHDIRSPLHTMAIYLGLVKGRVGAPDRERQTKHLEVVESEIPAMELLLEHFFTQIRLESKGPEQLDLAGLVQGILEFLEPYRRSIYMEIVWEPPTEPVPVTATKDPIRHALVYLLVTALDAAAQKKPAQDLEQVRVQVLARDGLATLIVTAPPAWGASIRGLGQENGVQELSGDGRELEVARRALQREHATLEVQSGASRPTILTIQMPLAAAEV